MGNRIWRGDFGEKAMCYCSRSGPLVAVVVGALAGVLRARCWITRRALAQNMDKRRLSVDQRPGGRRQVWSFERGLGSSWRAGYSGLSHAERGRFVAHASYLNSGSALFLKLHQILFGIVGGIVLASLVLMQAEFANIAAGGHARSINRDPLPLLSDPSAQSGCWPDPLASASGM